MVAVIGPDAEAAASLVTEAAPDAEVLPVPATTAADAAVAVDDAVRDRASVISVSADLSDPTLLAAMQAATDAGVTVVVDDPDATSPDDVTAVVVGPDGVSGGDVDPTTATAYVTGAAALLAGQVTPAEVVAMLEGTAEGEDRVVNAEAAVELAANSAAGGVALPPPEDQTGGLRPALVGLIAFGAAGVVVGGTIWLASRKPRS